MISKSAIRPVAAEFLATALFVWIGCGTAIASQRWGDAGKMDSADLVSISLGFGLAITTLAYGIGHISGGHINPAVTFAFVSTKLMDWKTGLQYAIAQFSGAWFGALILWGCTASIVSQCTSPDVAGVCASSWTGSGYGPPFALGANTVGPKVTNGAAFLIELVGTYLLVITVMLSAVHPKSGAGNAAPIAIGWAVLLAHFVLVPFTGCGINPARSFGPLVVDSMGGINKWQRGWWVFFTAPFVGALFAALTYEVIFKPEEEEEEEEKVTAQEEAAALVDGTVRPAVDRAVVDTREMFVDDDDAMDMTGGKPLSPREETVVTTALEKIVVTAELESPKAEDAKPETPKTGYTEPVAFEDEEEKKDDEALIDLDAKLETPKTGYAEPVAFEDEEEKKDDEALIDLEAGGGN